MAAAAVVTGSGSDDTSAELELMEGSRSEDAPNAAARTEPRRPSPVGLPRLLPRWAIRACRTESRPRRDSRTGRAAALEFVHLSDARSDESAQRNVGSWRWRELAASDGAGKGSGRGSCQHPEAASAMSPGGLAGRSELAVWSGAQEEKVSLGMK
ncbi:hypothetical protein AXG93_3384s1820 [Marchantia polymorpha subsp. ruderalis]|uniref:Uncharacterized protein n=1 Tax=Marchantia polymorpha subsp. ruderalis TaxID=1480154 RepID=A0A176WEN7_MARPO|nr:hypothetical protein AXG93_3384s1820 [Marchantia polymorpha subsp. ruderalis]